MGRLGNCQRRSKFRPLGRCRSSKPRRPQKTNIPAHCQPMTVSGLTMTRESFQRGHRRERKTQNTRSSGRSHGRGLSRFRTATCWRRAMFSSCNGARLRTISRTKATRITTIVCMLRTVAGNGLKCQDFRSRRGFEERQAAAGAHGGFVRANRLEPGCGIS